MASHCRLPADLLSLYPQLFIFSDATHQSPSLLPAPLPPMEPGILATGSHPWSLWLCKCEKTVACVLSHPHQSPGAMPAVSQVSAAAQTQETHLSPRLTPTTRSRLRTSPSICAPAHQQPGTPYQSLLQHSSMGIGGEGGHAQPRNACRQTARLPAVASEVRSGLAFCHWVAQLHPPIPSFSSYLSACPHLSPCHWLPL